MPNSNTSCCRVSIAKTLSKVKRPPSAAAPLTLTFVLVSESSGPSKSTTISPPSRSSSELGGRKLKEEGSAVRHRQQKRTGSFKHSPSHYFDIAGHFCGISREQSSMLRARLCRCQVLSRSPSSLHAQSSQSMSNKAAAKRVPCLPTLPLLSLKLTLSLRGCVRVVAKVMMMMIAR